MNFLHISRFSALVALMSTATTLFTGCNGTATRSAVDEECAYQQAEGFVLGAYLAGQLPTERCVIVKAPRMKTADGRAVESPLVKGIKDGMGPQANIAFELELPMALPPAPEKDTPVRIGPPEADMSLAAFTELLAACKDYAVLIVCTPLPQGVISPEGAILIPSLKDKKFVLAAGYSPSLRRAVDNGTILAAVTTRADAQFDGKPCPDIPTDAFAKRYELVTPAAAKNQNDNPTP